jgi:hypothetical protein
MKLTDALRLSSIATLTDGNVRYFATNLRLYKEEYDEHRMAIKSERVQSDRWQPIVNKEGWEALGYESK